MLLDYLVVWSYIYLRTFLYFMTLDTMEFQLCCKYCDEVILMDVADFRRHKACRKG